MCETEFDKVAVGDAEQQFGEAESEAQAPTEETNTVDEGCSAGGGGVWRELGDLPSGAIISEEALARIFGRHPVSIKRAVQRGELPPPTRLLGGPVWTVGAILNHVEGRLEAARKDAERTERKLRELSP